MAAAGPLQQHQKIPLAVRLEEVWSGFSPPWGGSGPSAAGTGRGQRSVPVPHSRHRGASTWRVSAGTTEPVGPRGFILLGFMQL